MIRQWLLLALLLVFVVGLVWFLTTPAKVNAIELTPGTPDVDNGRTMFNAGGCASCHAPNQQERARLAGGMALKSPFGTFYSPNISPHPVDGIGGWSEADFVSAMWKGTSPDGFGINALAGQISQLHSDLILDLAVHIGLRHGELVPLHQSIDQLFLGRLLGNILLLLEDGLAPGISQLPEILVIPQVASKFVIEGRQLPLPDELGSQLEAHGLACEFLLPIILRIGNVQINHGIRRSTDERLVESRQGLFATYLNLDVLFDRLRKTAERP